MNSGNDDPIVSRRDFLQLTASVATAPLLGMKSKRTPSAFRVALLKDNLPAMDSEAISRLHQTLSGNEFSVTHLSVADLIHSDSFNRSLYDCVILTDSPHLPGVAIEPLGAFLRAGGHMVALGGRAFTDPTVLIGARWLTRSGLDDWLSASPTNYTFFDFKDGSLAAWGHSTNKPEHGSRLLLTAAPFGKCMELDIKNLGEWQWDTFYASLPHPFPPQDNLFCFQAKGGALSPQLAVEIDETDGARWVATVDLTTQWRHFALPESRFHFLADSSPKSRGGNGDHPRLANAARVSFGLATGLSRYHYGDNLIWVGNIGSGMADIPQRLDFGASLDLPLFGDYEPYDLGDARRVNAADRQEYPPKDISIKGRFTGVSAVGFGLANKSAFTPLLEARDAYGEYRGWALGMMVNYGGEYKGSCWIFSGVKSQSLYRDPFFIGALMRSLKRIRETDVVDKTAKRANLENAQIPRLTSPAPKGFLRLSKDRRSFLKPNGTPLFMTGCNYLGRENRFCQLTPSSLEEDFRRAHLAGINVFRIWVGCSDPEGRHRDAIRECARKYGIYLIPQIGAVGADGDTVVAKAKETASYWKDEPMVLGYDLQNEPYLGTIAPIRFDGKPSPLLELNPYDKYSDKINRNLVANQIKQRPAWPQILGSPSARDLQNLYASYWIYDQWVSPFMETDNDATTFPKLNGQIPLTGPWADFAVALNETFDRWIQYAGGAVRDADPHHYISVGYNTVLSCLPCNKRLDFVSQHLYQTPHTMADVMKSVTAMDRLSIAWPDKPISLGEFGYTNGIPVGDGFLDIDSSAVGEMIHYLYAFSRGYSGCLKWMLIDLPAPIVRDNIPWITPDNYYEERFGIYWDDGTPQGRPKPIAYALAFLKRYIELGGAKGKLEIIAGDNPIHTAYRFHSPNAIFVGDTKYESPSLKFTSPTGKPGNLMLMTERGKLSLLSTVHAKVELDPTKWVPAPHSLKGMVVGKTGGWRKAGTRIVMDVLEGEILGIE